MIMTLDIEYDEIVKFIEDEKTRLNLDWVEVRIENVHFEKIYYLNDRLKEVSDSHLIGVGIRVIKDGRIGFASTSWIDKDDIRNTVRDARSIAEINPHKSELNRNVFDGIYEKRGYRYHPTKVSYEDKLRLIKAVKEGVKNSEEALEESRFKPDYFKQESISIRYGSYYGEIYVWNSDGTNIIFKPLLSGIIVSTIVKYEDKFGDSYEIIGGSDGLDPLMDEDRLNSLGIKTLAKALEKVVAGYPEAGFKRVITSPRISGVFAHESFGHMSEADHIVANASPLKDRIGDVLGSEYASIVDDGTPAYGGFYYPVDSEGVVTKRVVLLDKGILKNYLLEHNVKSFSYFINKKGKKSIPA